MIVFQVVLPVFLVFLIGFIGQKTLHLNVKAVSTFGLYIMSPFLVFSSFYKTALNKTYLDIMIYGILLSVLIIILVKFICHVKRYSSSITSGLILSTAFMNNGNLGTPIALFAFGDQGFRYAVTIMVFHSIIMSTLGIYYAAKGKSNVKHSLLSVLKMPITHAAVIGILWQQFSMPMPENIFKVITWVGDASIPTVMLALGMQLAEIRPKNLERGKIVLAIFIRLVISPVIAWTISLFLGVPDVLAKVMIISAAMPSAAFTTMYALQYNSEPDLVSSITFISTIFSIGTLSLLLVLLC